MKGYTMVEDLSGRTYGEWTVIDRAKNKNKDARWNCRCSCGTEKIVLGKYLRNGKSKSCGGENHNIDITGNRYGKLQVLKRQPIEDKKLGHDYWLCVCDCGVEKVVSGVGLRNGKINSCGCSRKKYYDGNQYGKLTVVKTMHNYKNNQTYCLCKCSCGNDVIVRACLLISGNTQSCGCKHNKNLIGMKFGKLDVIAQAESLTPQRKWLCLCECGQKISVNSYSLTSGHTTSCGCSRSESVSIREVFVQEYLKNNNITYTKEQTFDGCIGIGGKKLRFDFYIEKYRLLIECDGEQHFHPVEYFGGMSKYEELKYNDNVKDKYCKDNNYCLVRLPYYLSDDSIIKILDNIFKSPVETTVA